MWFKYIHFFTEVCNIEKGFIEINMYLLEIFMFEIYIWFYIHLKFRLSTHCPECAQRNICIDYMTLAEERFRNEPLRRGRWCELKRKTLFDVCCDCDPRYGTWRRSTHLKAKTQTICAQYAFPPGKKAGDPSNIKTQHHTHTQTVRIA